MWRSLSGQKASLLGWFNPFVLKIRFLYPLETSENSDIFRDWSVFYHFVGLALNRWLFHFTGLCTLFTILLSNGFICISLLERICLALPDSRNIKNIRLKQLVSPTWYEPNSRRVLSTRLGSCRSVSFHRDPLISSICHLLKLPKYRVKARKYHEKLLQHEQNLLEDYFSSRYLIQLNL